MAAWQPNPLAAAAIAQLEADGVATLIGTVVNPAGLTHAKTVPLRRMGTFADPGLGASPVWHVFAIDQAGIVFGDAIGVVGDQRIRIDLSALRILGDGLAWAPGAFFNQDGSAGPVLQSRRAAAESRSGYPTAGIDTVVGHEMEFVLVGPDGSALPVAPVGAVRPGRRARVRGVRAGCHQCSDRFRRRHRTVPPRVRRQPVRDLAVPAVTRRRGRPTGADAHHHRQGGPAVRSASQPVAGTVRGQRRIRFSPTLFDEDAATLRCSPTVPVSAG